eukprot:1393175-Amorphochlora_amoeboformis.AAC.1
MGISKQGYPFGSQKIGSRNEVETWPGVCSRPLPDGLPSPQFSKDNCRNLSKIIIHPIRTFSWQNSICISRFRNQKPTFAGDCKYPYTYFHSHHTQFTKTPLWTSYTTKRQLRTPILARWTRAYASTRSFEGGDLARKSTKLEKKLVVVGGGAAGFMAAIE